jgi:hypothetical protein
VHLPARVRVTSDRVLPRSRLGVTPLSIGSWASARSAGLVASALGLSRPQAGVTPYQLARGAVHETPFQEQAPTATPVFCLTWLSYGEVVGAPLERLVIMVGKRQLADDDIRSPADELTQDMSRGDLVFVLENLKFGKQTTATKNQFCSIREFVTISSER